MRILKYSLILLGLLCLIPLAAAQDSNPVPASLADSLSYTVQETDHFTFDDLIAELGCPVGLRDFNRVLLLNSDGTIAAGQILMLPSASSLCAIDYAGDIEFISVSYDKHTREEAGDYRGILPLSEFAAEKNVCEAAIRQLNPEWVAAWETYGYGELFFYDPVYSSTAPSYIRLPLDSPACFETVELAALQHPRELAKSLNLCEQVLWYFNPESIYEVSNQARSVYIPLDTQPCYQDGQVLAYLGYPNQWGDYVPAEAVILDKPTNVHDYAIENGYCAADLYALNRHQNLAPLQTGDSLYIPADARHCDYVQEIGTTVRQLASEYNVCIETILELNNGISTWTHLEDPNITANRQASDVSYGGIFVPSEAPACYDENGLRISHKDRAVHETSKEEWLFAIAQNYDVCMLDLIAANPLLRDYPQTDLPSIIFIPNSTCSDVAADGFVHHQIQSEEAISYLAKTTNLMSISYVYNVCPSDILAANPNIIGDVREGYVSGWFYTRDNQHQVKSYWLNDIEAGQTILIPTNTLPCYDYKIPVRGIGHYQFVSSDLPQSIDYVCYAEEVNPDTDYTGHEPVISPIPYSADAHCYNRLEDPRIVLNNETYTLYPFGMDAYLFELAACFGANGYEIIRVDSLDLGLADGDWYSDSYWAIPNATQDCPLIGDDYEAARNWKRAFHDEAGFGQINENGLYAVTYGDTLTDIGRRYGYLPDWIKTENNLSDDWVYPYQLLRLPSYPNLYQLASVLGGLAALSLLTIGTKGILRLRNGRKGKKKNDQ